MFPQNFVLIKRKIRDPTIVGADDDDDDKK